MKGSAPVLFTLGRTVATPAVVKTVSGNELVSVLARHVRGDWRCMDDADQRANREALASGARVFSAFDLSDGRRLWVITEACDDEGNRASTTVLFPDEY